ncbi:hypothetical protein QPX44_09005 [Corynebacterium pseudodiphtheriticum]|nr:hypothetical protein [Corynebacterium pseudodiphtheriticum]MDK4286043.1 hypothetical protein [Corynebacterium pseudodiphtheriticum]MDK4316294.1 hypothetical protein [Corynebacterium pseudodiphtheriticum]
MSNVDGVNILGDVLVAGRRPSQVVARCGVAPTAGRAHTNRSV